MFITVDTDVPASRVTDDLPRVEVVLGQIL